MSLYFRSSPVRFALVVVALLAAAVYCGRSIWSAKRTSLRPWTPASDGPRGHDLRPPRTARFTTGTDRAKHEDYLARCDRAAALPDTDARFEAVRTALLAWSQADPAAALAWADRCPDDLRSGALTVVAEVLSAEPDRAVNIGSERMRQNPESADEVGSVLIGALVRRAAFSAALQLVAGGPAQSCESWCSLIVGAWAQKDPASALELAEALRRQDVQGPVFAALAQGWAQSAPEGLVRYGATLPAGSDRTAALRAGLDAWLLRDPSAAGAWIRQLSDPHDHDQALAAYLTRTDQLERPTPTGLALAEQIADPTLRFTTLQHLVRELAADNPPDVARRYVATIAGLDPQQRRQLVAALGRTSDADTGGDGPGR